MTEDEERAESPSEDSPIQRKPWYRQPILGLVVGAVVIAFTTTSISLYMYNTSDTALLDLSRPGYEEARAELDPEDDTSFSADGVITSETIDSFMELYEKQLNKTTANPFESDALSNTSLNLGDIPE